MEERDLGLFHQLDVDLPSAMNESLKNAKALIIKTRGICQPEIKDSHHRRSGDLSFLFPSPLPRLHAQ